MSSNYEASDVLESAINGQTSQAKRQALEGGVTANDFITHCDIDCEMCDAETLHYLRKVYGGCLPIVGGV